MRFYVSSSDTELFSVQMLTLEADGYVSVLMLPVSLWAKVGWMQLTGQCLRCQGIKQEVTCAENVHWVAVIYKGKKESFALGV